jgi:hypothetical protein
MWEIFAENTGWETIVFKMREQGEQWVRQRANMLYGERSMEHGN